MPALLLQKPFKSSKSKDHVKCLERRLNLWMEGEFNELSLECRAIQGRLLHSTAKQAESITKRFSDLMFLGKVNAALKLFSKEGLSGLVTTKVWRPFNSRPSEQNPSYNISGDWRRSHPINDCKTKGSSGPSQMDANMWHRMLLSKSFGDRSTDLSKAIAKMTTIMCTERCDKENGRDMEAFPSVRSWTRINWYWNLKRILEF